MVFCVFYHFVEGLTEVFHSFLKSSECLYDHFKFSIRYYLSILFSSFDVIFPIISFGTYSSVSSFHLTLGVCFYMLGMSATSCALENNGLMKKMSCSVVWYNVLCSSEPGTSEVSAMCVVHVLLL